MNNLNESKWQKEVLRDFKKSPSKINIENKKIFKKYLKIILICSMKA